MENVLAITESESFMITALRDKMFELGFNVILVRADIKAITEVKVPISAILLYGDQDIIDKDKLQPLNYVKDMVIEKNHPVFIIGNDEEINAFEKVVPKSMVQKEFLRPVNILEVSEFIADFLKNNSNIAKKKILVVDDSGAMLRNIKGWLEDKYQVILANSGAMALKYLALNSPDLVLLDYEMPVCDGKQVLEMIRSESEYSTIPVIFLTSRGDKNSVYSVTALKPNGYLLKTMPPAQIIKYIDDFFMKQKAASLKQF